MIKIRQTPCSNVWGNIRNDLRRVVKNIRVFFGTQHVSHIKCLSAFKPLGVICIDWKMWWGMDCLMNLLRASMYVSESATFVKRPAMNMISVMQLVENFKPIVQVRMSPA